MMDLKRAAQALLECGHTHVIEMIGGRPHTDYDVLVDPINNEAQLFALAFWFLQPDKTLTLTGDGHFNVREQLQNFVEENLK